MIHNRSERKQDFFEILCRSVSKIVFILGFLGFIMINTPGSLAGFTWFPSILNFMPEKEHVAFLTHQNAKIEGEMECFYDEFDGSESCKRACVTNTTCTIAEYAKSGYCKLCAAPTTSIKPGTNTVFVKKTLHHKPKLKRPYVYVYEVGDYLYDLSSGDHHDYCIGVTRGVITRFNPFGKETSHGHFSSEAQYELSFTFHYRFTESTHRVYSPEEADMVFVDYPVKYSHCGKGYDANDKTLEKLLNSKEFRNYVGKIPHFIIRDHDSFHAWPDFGAFDRPPLDKMYLLSMESQRTNAKIANPIRDVRAKYQFSIPFFTQNHIRDNATLRAQQETMLLQRRTTLFAFCGRIRDGKNTRHRKNGRKEFVRQLANITEDILAATSWNGMNFFEVSNSDCSSLYSRSVFCYNQGADTFTRKGNFDGWMQGCISMIQLDWIEEFENYPGLHLKRDEHYVVFDPIADNIEDFTRKYDANWANQARESISKMLGKTIYAMHYPEFHDAFENTLTELWEMMKKNPPEWRRE